MKRTILVLLPVLLIVSAFQLSTSTSRNKPGPHCYWRQSKTAIDATLKRFIDSGKIAGVSALVFEKGKEVYFNAFWLCRPRSQISHGPQYHCAHILSMTKPVTGCGVNVVIRQRRLSAR